MLRVMEKMSMPMKTIPMKTMSTMMLGYCIEILAQLLDQAGARACFDNAVWKCENDWVSGFRILPQLVTETSYTKVPEALVDALGYKGDSSFTSVEHWTIPCLLLAG